MVFIAGLFGFFVLLGNLLDYNSNFEFVSHVLAMDDTFEGNSLMWRAITSPVLHHIAYIGIIIAEAAFAFLGLAGGIRLFRLRSADSATYNRAKSWGYLAFALAMLIWFVGFVVIGSEWFAMWQSQAWNGKDTAMGIVTLFAGFSVLLALEAPAQE